MPPIDTVESVQLGRIADALERVATAHEAIAVDFNRWVDNEVAQGAVNVQLLETQLLMQQRALELMNQVAPPAPVIPPPVLP